MPSTSDVMAARRLYSGLSDAPEGSMARRYSGLGGLFRGLNTLSGLRGVGNIMREGLRSRPWTSFGSSPTTGWAINRNLEQSYLKSQPFFTQRPGLPPPSFSTPPPGYNFSSFKPTMSTGPKPSFFMTFMNILGGMSSASR